MINKIVVLRGKIKCRIIDVFLEEGYTKYMAIEINSERLLFVSPREVIDVIDENGESIIGDLIKNGI